MNKIHIRKSCGTNLFCSIFLAVNLFFFFSTDVLGAGESESLIAGGYSADEIKRGERFFKGLLPFERKSPACISCHNILSSDTLNWNPSAFDIANKFAAKDFNEFRSAVLEPAGTKMTASHVERDLGEEDLKLVKAYLDNLAQQGPPHVKPSIDNLLFFLLLGVLITWALLELIFFRKVKIRAIPLVVFLGAFGWQVKMVVAEGVRLGRQQDYAPDQPVKFSHKVHVGENGIDCMYCHTTAEHSKSAGIPAANLCLNCHILIREGTNSGKFEIAKVVDAVAEGENLEWIRIHNLPDHVFFSHAVHVGSGKLDCNTCHGPVEEMHVMKQFSDLSMGWCVNCHRETRVDFQDNGYYDTYVKLHEDLRAGKIDTIRAADIGANDCMRCHY